MFKERKTELENLIDEIRDFVNDGDVLPLLGSEKLGITESRTWMSDEDFQAAKDDCARGKPMFLVLGQSVAGVIKTS